MKLGAEPTQRPASGVAGAEAAQWASKILCGFLQCISAVYEASLGTGAAGIPATQGWSGGNRSHEDN